MDTTLAAACGELFAAGARNAVLKALLADAGIAEPPFTGARGVRAFTEATPEEQREIADFLRVLAAAH